MKKNFYRLTAMMCCFTLLTSCTVNSNKQDEQKSKAATQPTVQKELEDTLQKPLVGNDRDDHGCIASAGYQWSEILKDCIRPFEKGTRLSSSDEKQDLAAYLIFNADSSKVELFLPSQKSHPILSHKITTGNETIWNSKNCHSWSVKSKEGTWKICENDKVRFVKD